jgi:hypothetical protein
MKEKKLLLLLRRLLLGLVAAGFVVTAITVLPGNIEGQYRDVGIRCMCDCVNFLQFRNGKIVHYGSAHPPAKVIGRYTRNSDGSVDMYFDSFREGKPGEFLGRAYPRLLVTKFSWSTDGGTEWGIKHPKAFTVGRTIFEQEVTSKFINGDKSVTKTFYNRSLEAVRTELSLPRKQPEAKQ